MTIKEVLDLSSQKISRLDSEVILAYVLKKEKEFLFAYPDNKLTAYNLRLYSSLIRRRASGEPIAYLIGHKEFYGLDFEVNQDVLVPRPETELLVEEAIKIVNSLPRRQAGKQITVNKIADIGTGCGNIAISLAKNLQLKTYNLQLYATDLSPAALKIAKKNAQKHKVKIKFLRGDLLGPLPEKMDLIVANLPYLSNVQCKMYNAKLKYEPQIALEGGKDGLDLIKKMLKQAPHYLSPNGQILLEIDPGQANFFRENYPKTFFKKDLSNKTRIAIVPHQALL